MCETHKFNDSDSFIHESNNISHQSCIKVHGITQSGYTKFKSIDC